MAKKMVKDVNEKNITEQFKVGYMYFPALKNIRYCDNKWKALWQQYSTDKQ